MSADDSYYQKAAEEHGWSAETERYVSGLEKIAAQKKADDEQKAKDAAMYEEYLQVKAQAEQAKKLFPNLDLNAEMGNPDFARSSERSRRPDLPDPNRGIPQSCLCRRFPR